VGTRQYLAYGGKRGGDEYAFEPNYTGQRLDGSGLLYYQARYYDPQLGVFISPDSLIPDPTHYPAYHRYLYADANPLKYNDPTGHCAEAGLSPFLCSRVAQLAGQLSGPHDGGTTAPRLKTSMTTRCLRH
jgi:RHS repeat-associated protein